MPDPISDDELNMARRWAKEGMFDPPNPTVTINVGSLIARLDAVTAERDHWKANYDRQVAIKREGESQ